MPARTVRLLAAALLIVGASALAAPKAKVKLAAPGLTLLNLTKQEGDFYSDHLAQQLTLEGMQVVTPAEISSLIGLERQKAMLGCGDSSCLVELANALGVDAVVNGSLGRFGTSYQLNVKVLSARDASTVSAVSMRLESDTAVLSAMTQIASWLRPRIERRLKNPADPLGDLPTLPGGAGSGEDPGQAEAAPRFRTAITTNALQDYFAPNLELEKAIGERISFTVSAEFLINRVYVLGLTTSDVPSFTGPGLAVGLRFYPFATALSGMYLGVRATTRFLSESTLSGTWGVFAAGGAVDLGYELQLGHFLLGGGIGMGLDYLARDPIAPVPSGVDYYLDLGISLGYCF